MTQKKWQIKNACRWCGSGFKKFKWNGCEAYVCRSKHCYTKQLAHSLSIGPLRKPRTVYIPLPIGVDLLECEAPNALMGGSAGSAKSYTLRWFGHQMAYKYPKCRILLIREKLTELKTTHVQEGLEFEENILTGCKLNRTDLYFKYPNGSIMQLGHMENWTQYLSTQYDILLMDEIVTLPERESLLVMSRIGRREGFPGLMRAGSNPGGKEAAWVKRRFVDHDPALLDEDPSYNPDEWAYIPGTIVDNPYISDAYPKSLMRLPFELREAYLYGNWDIFIGQYFSEWRNRTKVVNGQVELTEDFSHVIPNSEIPPHIPRVCSIDWGYIKPGVAGWFALLPDGHAVLEEEYVFQRSQAPDVAKEIAKRSRSRHLERIRYVGDYEMWGHKSQTGESIQETFARFGVSMIQADKDRVNGWVRLRGWLRPAPDGKPWLQVMERCKYTTRTIPQQVMDENNPEDLDTDGDDHAADMMRYFVMNRPHPEQAAKTQTFKPGTVGALKEEIRKRNEKRWRSVLY